MEHPRSATRAALIAATVVIAMVLGACSGDDQDAATATTTSAAGGAGSTTPADGTTGGGSTTTTEAKGCPSTHSGSVPDGLAAGLVGDLDGDALPDVAYVGVTAGLRRFGVLTASGSRSEWTVQNASPVDPVVYGTADANQDGQPELFVNPGRVVYVLTLYHCKLQPYVNKTGDPYAFEVGFGEVGTGVGCVDADGDGRRDLVGLNEDPDQVAGKVSWSRTIVRLDGNQARNGPKDTGTYQSPADDKAIGLLTQVTCGDDAFITPVVAKPA